MYIYDLGVEGIEGIRSNRTQEDLSMTSTGP